jgi:hypothetical protein
VRTMRRPLIPSSEPVACANEISDSRLCGDPRNDARVCKHPVRGAVVAIDSDLRVDLRQLLICRH